MFNARTSITLRVRYTLSEYFRTAELMRAEDGKKIKSDFNSQPKTEQLEWHDCGFCFCFFLTQWKNVRVNCGGSERLNGLNIIYNQIPPSKQQNGHTYVWCMNIQIENIFDRFELSLRLHINRGSALRHSQSKQITQAHGLFFRFYVRLLRDDNWKYFCSSFCLSKMNPRACPYNHGYSCTHFSYTACLLIRHCDVHFFGFEKWDYIQTKM